ncbi:MAG: hypothetical protein F4Y74_08860 [Gemmatimonadales bacterium]|nr:hypothetical protein [Gemmatimonadales bacterium]MYG18867.1 hypothetical protein [Gemmatimonadales bacterium]MYH09274.1 hypothetical protein [Gemmatimonadales bacterium]MYL05261.1 hypothetical protein [Gemmatimonadales bacterium]
MTFIRRVAAAFTLWALAICVWAALSHLTSLPGPAKASTATLEGMASLVERADPPGSLRAPRFAAEQLRRTAHTAGRINGGIERAIGAWLDGLGHDAAHGRQVRFGSAVLVGERDAKAVIGNAHITIRMDASSDAGRARLAELHALRLSAGNPLRTRDAGIWIDRTEKAPAGSSEADLKLRAARHGETFSLKLAEAGSALDEASIRLDVDANLDRDKLKKRLEKLLDLLEDLQRFEGGR